MLKKITNHINNLISDTYIIRVKKVFFGFQNWNFKPYKLDKVLAGEKVSLWIGDRVGKNWYEMNVNEMNSYFEFIKEQMIEPNDVVFDCGAHHGLATMMFAKWVGDQGYVFAFEPVPNNIKIISKNVQNNELQNVELLNKAVGAEKGSVQMDGTSNSRIFKSKYGIKVDLIPLDLFMVSNPTFLKIDVEGFEIEVLKGAEKILKNLPKIVMEVHTDMLSRYGYSPKDIFSLIDISKYQIWIQWDDEQKPEIYDHSKEINQRVQLFFIPIT